MNLRFTEVALRDLEGLRTHIASSSDPVTADRISARIYAVSSS